MEGRRSVPIELLDVAGLVPGAHQGRGLGNKFLDDLRHADALIHVVDVSGTTDAEGLEYQYVELSRDNITDVALYKYRQSYTRIRPFTRYRMAEVRNCTLGSGKSHAEMVCLHIRSYITRANAVQGFHQEEAHGSQ